MAGLPPLRYRATLDEVIIGGGPHAAIYAATRAAIGAPRPVVIERRAVAGGVFAGLRSFHLNSVNRASIRSVAAGPTRVLPQSDSDDLNWLPNARHQVRDVAWGEYPTSQDVATTVARNLRLYADVYAGVEVIRIGVGSVQYLQVTDNGATYSIYPRRIIDARGQQMPALAGPMSRCPAVVTAEDFLAGKAGESARKVAVVGDGDTAAIVVESLLGQAPVQGLAQPEAIGWYGSALPTNKGDWMTGRHARYLGLARHFPQYSQVGMITPYPTRGEVTPVGTAALVNGQAYDLVIMATGFIPALTAQATISDVSSLDKLRPYEGGMRFQFYPYYVIGAAMGPVPFDATDNNLGFARFPANMAALFRLGPRTAQLAAALPA